MGNGAIRIGLDYAVARVAKVNTSFPAPAISASSTALGYAAGNALKWDRSLWRSNAGTSHSITLDFSATAWGASSYNAVMLWLNGTDSDNVLGATPITSITLQTSATGAFAGEEVTESAINSFAGTGYSTVIGSRVKSLKTAAARTLTGSPYVRVIWACSSASINLAKIAVANMEDPDVFEGNPQYVFEDRDTINTLESGGRTRYERDFRRSVTLNSKWEQVSNTIKTGAFIGERSRPIMAAIDWDNTLEATGQHIHTMPVTLDESLSYTIQQQFSEQRFNGGASYRFTEFL